MRAASLFSNCGAGDVGFAAAGFRFRVVSELVEKRLEVARLNHPGAVAVSGDLRRTWPVVVDSFREAHGSEAPVLLSGCPPCQGMSSARGDRGKENDPDAGSRDGRNLLVLPIAEVAKELRPMFVVVENVPAFLRRRVWDPDSTTPRSAAKILCNRLESDYCVYATVVDLCEFGIPQHRSRAFLTLVRKDTDALGVLKGTGRAPFPAPTHGGPDSPDFVTIDDALRESGLPALDAGSAETAGSNDHPMHRVPVWLDRRYDMVAAIPPGKRCRRMGNGSLWAVRHEGHRPHRGRVSELPEPAASTDRAKRGWFVAVGQGIPKLQLPADGSDPTGCNHNDRERAHRERPDAASLGESGPQPCRMRQASDHSQHFPVGRLDRQMGAYRCPSDDRRSCATPVHDAPRKGPRSFGGGS